MAEEQERSKGTEEQPRPVRRQARREPPEEKPAEEPQGQHFLGMPMNWEWDLRKILRNYWNPEDDRLFPPKVFGIGWDVNMHAVLRRTGLAPTQPKEGEEE